MRKTRKFTLIELLLVIGIMILIMGLTVPSFRRMASGNAVNAAARMLSGQLKLARAAAISEQRYVAIVMPGWRFREPGTISDDNNHYHFRSFRAAIVEPTANNEFSFVGWYPGSSWAFLPQGAVIAEVNGDCGINETNATRGQELYQDAHGTRHINLETGADAWLKNGYILEDEDRIHSPSDNSDRDTVVDGASSYLAEFLGDDGITEKHRTNNTHGSSNTSYCARAIVFSPKGRCCMNRGIYADRYITIVEGRVEGQVNSDGEIRTGSNEPPTLEQIELNNMRILRIAGLTGKVEYVNLDMQD